MAVGCGVRGKNSFRQDVVGSETIWIVGELEEMGGEREREGGL